MNRNILANEIRAFDEEKENRKSIYY